MYPRPPRIPGLRLALALTLLLGTAPSPRAAELAACADGNTLPLSFRILDLSRSQLRYIHWVKVWRFAAEESDPGANLPRPSQMLKLAEDLRARRQELSSCARELIHEARGLGKEKQVPLEKAVQALERSRQQLARLDQSLLLGELQLERLQEEGRRSHRRAPEPAPEPEAAPVPRVGEGGGIPR